MFLYKLISIRNLLVLLPLLFCSSVALGQISITGPDCVLTTLTYQYDIKGERKPNDKINVCVEGGVLSESGNTCIQSDNLSSIHVKWGEGKTTGKITVKSLSGSATVSVNIVAAFNPGFIETTDRQVISYNKLSPSLSCTQASGGTCSPAFSYQWEWSLNRLRWEEVPGATGRNLSFSTPLKQSAFFRRKVVESKLKTTGYSNIISVFVRPEAKTK